MSKITKSYERFKPREALFRCPICGGEMEFQNENSLTCEKNHCFDLSKHGYINFVPGQGKTKYKKTLFESRRIIFENGFYDPLISEIQALIKQYAKPDASNRLLDVGCGEGVLLAKILENIEPKPEVFALDLAKEAIVLAGKQEAPIQWMVGDLSHIPMKSGMMDILLNILTPANYGEFSRILGEGGVLIKAIPGENYLIQLRNAVKTQLHRKEYSNENVVTGFEKHTIVLEQKKLQYQVDVNLQQVKLFAEMTPLMLGVEEREITLDDVNEITIDMEILVGRKP